MGTFRLASGGCGGREGRAEGEVLPLRKLHPQPPAAPTRVVLERLRAPPGLDLGQAPEDIAGRGNGEERPDRVPVDRTPVGVQQGPYPFVPELEVHGRVGDVVPGTPSPRVLPVDEPEAPAVVDEVLGEGIAVDEALPCGAGRIVEDALDALPVGCPEPAAPGL